jgi:hypothetical protein
MRNRGRPTLGLSPWQGITGSWLAANTALQPTRSRTQLPMAAPGGEPQPVELTGDAGSTFLLTQPL